jgi:hypothetical protein
MFSRAQCSTPCMTPRSRHQQTQGRTARSRIAITGCEIPRAVTSPGDSIRSRLGPDYPQVA